MIITLPNTVLPGNVYGILDARDKEIALITANTAHEALREATEKLGSRARVAIIKSQLDKEQYARSSTSPGSTGSTISAEHASARALTRAIDSAPISTGLPSIRHTTGTRGAWKPGTRKRG